MLEKIGWGLLASVAILYIIFLIAASVAAFPFGIIGLLVIGGCGFIFAQVVKDRVSSEEDAYYSKNVDL